MCPISQVRAGIHEKRALEFLAGSGGFEEMGIVEREGELFRVTEKGWEIATGLSIGDPEELAA